MGQVKTVSPSQLARARGNTLNHIYQLLWAGRVRGATKQGTRWVIPVSSIARPYSPEDRQVDAGDSQESTIAAA
jgi:hypothetical protein